ncbi:Uncharacterised protein [Yersinia kristensenii]|nr:Uncharacterised protein [Yersinia kristensenii]
MRGRGVQPDSRRRGPQITGLTDGQSTCGTDMMHTAESIGAAQSHCGIGVDIAIAAQHIRQHRIGPVQVQVTQHIDAAGAQCSCAAQSGGGAVGNIGLPRQTAVGGTDS